MIHKPSDRNGIGAVIAPPSDSPARWLIEMAQASLRDQALDARVAGLALERWAATHALADIPKPKTDEPTLVVCAALIELFAQRGGQPAPNWAAAVGGLEQPFYFFPVARKNAGFRAEIERQTPEPLRKRNLFATQNFLRHV